MRMRPPPKAVEPDVPVEPKLPRGPVPDLRPRSWPATHLPASEIEARAEMLPFAHVRDRVGIHGTRGILAALESFPGDGWQERWLAAGCDQAGGDWVAAIGDPWADMAQSSREQQSTGGLSVLVTLDVIRPSYEWLNQARLTLTYRIVRDLRDLQFAAQVAAHIDTHAHPVPRLRASLLVISKMMLHTGEQIGEITPEDMVVYYQAAYAMRRQVVGIDYAWDLLNTFGGFPVGTPTFREYVSDGPMSAADMIDYYQLTSQPVRDMLIRCIADRAPGMDYKSLRSLAYKLAKCFWKDLEEHHPGISSLDLDERTASGWKARLHAAPHGPVADADRCPGVVSGHRALGDPRRLLGQLGGA